MNGNKKSIWITGASSGIGKAAAKEFARVGSNVIVSARRTIELERLNNELAEEKLGVNIFPCNVASAANVDQTHKKIISDGFKIDCLVNNAGITAFKKAEDNSINEIDDIIHTNLMGAIYCIKAVLPVMIENGGGTIINISSVVTKKVFTHSTAYAASKLGLKGYTDSLREEVRKYNIRVIDIVPGATVTAMWSREVRKENAERMLTPEEIANVIVWAYLQKGNLVSEEILLKPMQGDL
ncbi:MAG: SDR family oxidoreductase [Ignavibacteriaceae bacterium]|nr:SDR family oxidoreductase [Ignavibacteriaceae bacterium]